MRRTPSPGAVLRSQHPAPAATILRSYSTATAGRKARLTYWNDLHCDVFSPLEVRPLDRASFEASLTVEDLGPLTLVKTYTSAASIEHTDRHLRQTRDRRAFLFMPITGKVSSSHYGYDVDLDEGDFALSDSFAPGHVAFAEPNQSLGVSIPYDTLTLHIPDPEAIFGRRLAGNAGFAELVSSMLRALWAQAERGLPSEFGPSLANNLLGLLATAYAIDYKASVTESSVQCARRAQIKRFVERRLRDADLNANAVAQGLGLSTRYIRRLFANEGESVSDYILRRRLEECARQLTSPLWLGRSITDTAFEWGFSSMAHFTRAFKDRYAVTPSDYRRGRSSQQTAS
ncbi:MAG TPA: helix-turn-helix domain-containing protein [Gammaproteobacteria bacterium]|nr:helix-turn-helix domain-containing protein [Gammaproteobacteria bacterium]